MNLPHSRSALESHLKFKLGLIQKSRKRNTPESSLRSIARARPSAHPAALHPLLLAAGTFGLPRHPKAWGLGAIWGCRRQPSSPKRSGLHIDCTSAASQTSGPAEAFGNFRVYAVYAVPSIKNTATPSLETCFRPSRIAASQAEIPLEALPDSGSGQVRRPGPNATTGIFQGLARADGRRGGTPTLRPASPRDPSPAAFGSKKSRLRCAVSTETLRSIRLHDKCRK